MAFTMRRHGRPLARAALVLLCMLGALPARAAEVSGLYTAEVPWQRAEDASREVAYADALGAVLARIVPFDDRAAAQRLFEEPARWVLGWREGEAGTLVVSFDGRAMTSLLRAQRVPVWDENRPATLVWLAIEGRDGTRRLLDSLEPPDPEPSADAVAPPSAPAESAEPIAFGPALADAAQRFGIPLLLPRLDDVDRAAVTDSDIWGGFGNVIREASARYGVDSVLVGRVSERSPASVRWTWLFGGDETRFGGDMNVAMSRIAGRLMSRYASSPDGSVDVRISVVAVDGLDAYLRLMQFMNSRSLLERVSILEMRGDQVLLSVDALASRERLAGLLEGSVLERIEAPFGAARVPLPGPDLAADPLLVSPDSPVIADDAPAPATIRLDRVDLYYRLRQPGGAGD